MQVIHLNKISLRHGQRALLRDLMWSIDGRERIGLVGANGAGKSTLLRLIVGELVADSGVVTVAKSAKLAYLPQTPVLPDAPTVLEAALVLPPSYADFERRLTAVEQRLGDPDVYGDSNRLDATLAEQERLLAAYEASGGAAYASKVRELLARFRLAEHLPTASLSGGQKKLLALARLAAEQPNVLLLDEPDNHLDLAAKHLLETFLRGFDGAVVIVSHDRYLLDEAVTHIAELEDGKLTVYAGGYSRYALQREEARLRQAQMYIAQQKRVQQIEDAIHRFDLAARADLNERHARQARSRRKMLERMENSGELVERVTERKQMQLTFDGWRGSTKALEIVELAMAFGDDLLFADLDLLVRHGERVGVIGPNGAGKSVLFSLIRGERQPFAGEIRIGPSVRPGYYAQEHETLALWLDKTPLQFIRDAAPLREGAAVNTLLRFLFTYEQTGAPIRLLSGGERSRLQLAALMLQNPNLLLLDEPTNNLDIPSAEALEEALEGFEGAALIISHDRYFLDRVVDRVVELRDGALTGYPGGYTEFLEAQAAAQAKRQAMVAAKNARNARNARKR